MSHDSKIVCLGESYYPRISFRKEVVLVSLLIHRVILHIVDYSCCPGCNKLLGFVK